MRVLIACEESQTVCKAFRKLGHEAYSCDVQECSGGYPEWHIKDDVLEVLENKWDLVIAHPPCTYLSNSGVSWLYKDETRWKKMISGAVFFRKILESRCEKICIENPIMHKYAREIIGESPSQVIQPYMFGHKEKKATCLWIKNLPLLVETKNVYQEMMFLPKRERERLHYLPPSKERSKLRSKTFQGIADAMAEQWGKL